MSKVSKANKSPDQIRLTPRGQRAKALGVGLGIAALAAGVGELANLANDSGHVLERDQAVALHSAEGIKNSVIVLKSGARYRLAPISSSGLGMRTGSVPKGQEMVISNPLVTSAPNTPYTLDESGWIAFTPPGTSTTDIRSFKDRADVTVYADLPKLEQEGYAQVYPGDLPRPIAPKTNVSDNIIAAHVQKDGAIKLTYNNSVFNEEATKDGSIYYYRDPAPVPMSQDRLAVSYLETAGAYESQVPAQ